MARIKDMYGKKYLISNIDNLKKHILNYHTVNGEPDNSIHEENGYYFKVDSDFMKILRKLS